MITFHAQQQVPNELVSLEKSWTDLGGVFNRVIKVVEVLWG